ncbi:autophagy-related protein 9-like isoform X2 [Olea europaea var. sylvestris]|uniref:Autophagy-related protein 9 n=1 Tax=Olea europaea subsp. europaea TaxID=158383 RepID=A0A8S0QRU9_OLEEU|nr:autophagy-related protein 9-like isoform X2 [Olea europaea var. sylvestris]CAA2967870.1 autophagy-related 9 [Olea europaea subsp. europaea]
MVSGHKVVHALRIFKWKWHARSSLTTGLLDEIPHGIELSDYHKAPSHGSESPSGLLDGDTLILEPIGDLDLFFQRIYSYYCEKGLWCIIIKWIFELLSLAFTICFSGFFLLYVDWNGLRNAKCGMVAVESGIKPCDLSKEALHEHPLTPFTLIKSIIVGYLAIFSIYWIFCFLRFFAQLKETLKIRHFYHNSLHVTDKEIQTTPWALILEKVVKVQSVQQLSVVKDLSIHDVVMRLMRKENYLIGMLNKGVLALPIPRWIPGAGSTVSVDPDGLQRRLVLPKTLEWTLNWYILESMFDRNFCIRRDFVSDPKTLKKRLMIVGFAMLLLSPFLVIFMLVYLFLRHAEQFYNHPSTASSRRWSNLSKWMFREFNEVDHLFKHRMNTSIVHASDYIKQFPSPILTIVAKFISFVSGGFAAVLIIIAFLEESLLEGHIFGRNLLWYAAVFGTITAISRAAMIDELLVLDPQGEMLLVVQHTHYMPKRWRGKENTETVRLEFETLFQYTGMMLLEDMASIFLTPYLLLFVVPKRVDDILQFIMDFTVDVEGVGHVCRKYGSPFNSSRNQRSSQGKMEKSFLSFQITYPSWEPGAQGKQFIASLRTFRDQKLQGQEMIVGHFTPGLQQLSNQNFRGLGDRNNSFLWETPFTNRGTFDQFGSMWLIDGEQKNFPYIIDWFYTSQNHERADNLRNVPSRRDEENSKDFLVPPHFMRNETQNEERYLDNWERSVEDRMKSELEASTSAPLFRESVLQHHDSHNVGDPTRSHWWARTSPQDAGLQTSFLEPPNFFHDASRDYYDHFSEGGVEEEPEQLLDWRNSRRLSRTFYMDNLEAGEFNLAFDDIYRRPSESPSEDADPANVV